MRFFARLHWRIILLLRNKKEDDITGTARPRTCDRRFTVFRLFVDLLAHSHSLIAFPAFSCLALLLCSNMSIACCPTYLRVRQVLRSNTDSWLGHFGLPGHTFIFQLNLSFPFYWFIWPDLTCTRKILLPQSHDNLAMPRTCYKLLKYF